MKKLFFTLLLVALAMPMMAENRSDSEMAAIASQKLFGAQVKGLNGAAATSLKRVFTDKAIAVFTPENEGRFVIVGRDDRLRPVLGYAKGAFDINKIPCGMKAWLSGINRTLQKMDAAGIKDAAPLKSDVDFTPVSPLITTKWTQDEPYNDLLPMVGEGDLRTHALTGCVATAMGQVMNYWQWPAAAEFTGSYYLNNLPTPFSVQVNSQYSWPLKTAYGWYLIDGYEDPEMADSWDQIEYTEDEAKAIATLMRDCGAAVKMQYEYGVASSMLSDAAVAFPKNFSYSASAIQFRPRMYYTDEEWLSFIYSELQAQRPIIYGAEYVHEIEDSETKDIYEVAEAHAFILHGIDADGLIDINWGWYGWCDGSYALDAFNCPQGNFNDNAQMLTGITVEPLPIDAYHSCMVTSECKFYYTPNENPAIKVTLDNFHSSTYQTFTGRFYMVIQDLDGGEPAYMDIYRQENDVTLNMGAGYQQFLGYPEAASFEPRHSYRLYVASRAANEDSYQPVRYYGKLTGPICFTLTIDDSGNGVITGPEIMEEFLLTGVKTVKQEPMDDGITRVYDMQGRLVHTAPTATFNLWKVPARGVLVVKQGNTVRKVAR